MGGGQEVVELVPSFTWAVQQEVVGLGGRGGQERGEIWA